MYTLLCNVQITRRTSMCFVMNDEDALAWSGKSVYGAIEYLVENHKQQFILEGPNPEDRYLLSVSKA